MSVLGCVQVCEGVSRAFSRGFPGYFCKYCKYCSNGVLSFIVAFSSIKGKGNKLGFHLN